MGSKATAHPNPPGLHTDGGRRTDCVAGSGRTGVVGQGGGLSKGCALMGLRLTKYKKKKMEASKATARPNPPNSNSPGLDTDG